MTKIGYAAMLEQFHPTPLLDYCAQAEAAGFSAGFMVSEHFHPWTPAQGQSAFAWAFMGALGGRTSLPFGTAVTCPGFRYHPAVIAHAAATPKTRFNGTAIPAAMNVNLIAANATFEILDRVPVLVPEHIREPIRPRDRSRPPRRAAAPRGCAGRCRRRPSRRRRNRRARGE